MLLMTGWMLSPTEAEAQSGTDLRELIRTSITQLADSLCRVNGEQWSGAVWSSVPDLRQSPKETRTNGFVLEELNIEHANTAVDPSGQYLSLVSLSIRGSLLLSDGRKLEVESAKGLNVVHDGQQSIEERYPELLRKDSSVWSNVIQPVLVALGAAAIIALFFFVRS